MSSLIEVERIWSRDGTIEIVASLHERLHHPEVVLVLRDHPEITMPGRARRDGPVISVTYSAEALALACPEGTGCWDAFLEAEAPDGRVRLRMGRHGDDIADKRKVMVYPGQLAGDVLVRPRYTVANNLSIDCRPRNAS